MAAKVSFPVGEPIQVALASTDGVLKEGTSGHFWTFYLDDDRVMLVPQAVRDQIQKLGISMGQKFTITRCRKSDQLASRWMVRLSLANQQMPEFAVHTEGRTKRPNSEQNGAGNGPGTPKRSVLEIDFYAASALRIALQRVVDAAIDAQRYACAPPTGSQQVW